MKRRLAALFAVSTALGASVVFIVLAKQSPPPAPTAVGEAPASQAAVPSLEKINARRRAFLAALVSARVTAVEEMTQLRGLNPPGDNLYITVELRNGSKEPIREISGRFLLSSSDPNSPTMVFDFTGRPLAYHEVLRPFPVGEPIRFSFPYSGLQDPIPFEDFTRLNPDEFTVCCEVERITFASGEVLAPYPDLDSALAAATP